MRETFDSDLAVLEKQVHAQLKRASATLETIADAVTVPSATRLAMITPDVLGMRRASYAADAELVLMTARQAPVASDLRLVLALIQLAQHVGLIANQFELITIQLQDVNPDMFDRQGTGEKCAEMAKLAGAILQRASIAFVARDLEVARAVDRDDDAIDQLNRRIFEATLALDGDFDERELALRHVLIARSLERIGDNAVDIAEQAVFLVTAKMLQFSDASRAKARRR
jgi:phosphate transport system protein